MFLGVDIGTTSVKALVVEEEGKIVASFSRPLQVYAPDGLSREQNPLDWQEAVLSLLQQVSEQYRIVSIGLTGQMHSLVMLDKQDLPVRHSILWCDQRTTKACRELTEILGGEAEVIRRVGNPFFEGFTLPKIQWVKTKERENYEKTRSILLPKDYIGFVLTGEKGTDPSDASGTGAFGFTTDQWDEELLALCEIDSSLFPKVTASGSLRGFLRKDLSNRFGWENVRVVTGGADNAVAALGAGINEPGLGMVSVGTSGTVVVATQSPKPDPSGRVHYFNHALPRIHYYMGVMLSATHSLDWFLNRFGKKGSWSELETAISNSEPGSRGLLFLPYLNGERTPYRNADAKGVLFGITSSHTEGDAYRSIIEGISFGLRDSYELIKTLTPIRRLRIVGGGAKNKTWVRIIASNLSMPLEIPKTDQGAAYGAAMLAAVGAGHSDKEILRWVQVEETVDPHPEWEKTYQEGFRGYQKLYSTLKEMFSLYPPQA
ncbi:MAG TPA: xylulokinase [Thermotogota bacterium]|nr:xylulokinase [Thermotogota bacterium]